MRFARFSVRLCAVNSDTRLVASCFTEHSEKKFRHGGRSIVCLKTSAASARFGCDARLVRLSNRKKDRVTSRNGPCSVSSGHIVPFLCKKRGCIPLARNRIQCGAGKEKQTGRHIRRQPGKRQLVAPKGFITTETRAAAVCRRIATPGDALETQKRYPGKVSRAAPEGIARKGAACGKSLRRFPINNLGTDAARAGWNQYIRSN